MNQKDKLSLEHQDKVNQSNSPKNGRSSPVRKNGEKFNPSSRWNYNQSRKRIVLDVPVTRNYYRTASSPETLMLQQMWRFFYTNMKATVIQRNYRGYRRRKKLSGLNQFNLLYESRNFMRSDSPRKRSVKLRDRKRQNNQSNLADSILGHNNEIKSDAFVLESWAWSHFNQDEVAAKPFIPPQMTEEKNKSLAFTMDAANSIELLADKSQFQSKINQEPQQVLEKIVYIRERKFVTFIQESWDFNIETAPKPSNLREMTTPDAIINPQPHNVITNLQSTITSEQNGEGVQSRNQNLSNPESVQFKDGVEASSQVVNLIRSDADFLPSNDQPIPISKKPSRFILNRPLLLPSNISKEVKPYSPKEEFSINTNDCFFIECIKKISKKPEDIVQNESFDIINNKTPVESSVDNNQSMEIINYRKRPENTILKETFNIINKKPLSKSFVENIEAIEIISSKKRPENKILKETFNIINKKPLTKSFVENIEAIEIISSKKRPENKILKETFNIINKKPLTKSFVENIEAIEIISSKKRPENKILKETFNIINKKPLAKSFVENIEAIEIISSKKRPENTILKEAFNIINKKPIAKAYVDNNNSIEIISNKKRPENKILKETFNIINKKPLAKSFIENNNSIEIISSKIRPENKILKETFNIINKKPLAKSFIENNNSIEIISSKIRPENLIRKETFNIINKKPLAKSSVDNIQTYEIIRNKKPQTMSSSNAEVIQILSKKKELTLSVYKPEQLEILPNRAEVVSEEMNTSLTFLNTAVCDNCVCFFYKNQCNCDCHLHSTTLNNISNFGVNGLNNTAPLHMIAALNTSTNLNTTGPLNNSTAVYPITSRESVNQSVEVSQGNESLRTDEDEKRVGLNFRLTSKATDNEDEINTDILNRIKPTVFKNPRLNKLFSNIKKDLDVKRGEIDKQKKGQDEDKKRLTLDKDTFTYKKNEPLRNSNYIQSSMKGAQNMLRKNVVKNVNDQVNVRNFDDNNFLNMNVSGSTSNYKELFNKLKKNK